MCPEQHWCYALRIRGRAPLRTRLPHLSRWCRSQGANLSGKKRKRESKKKNKKKGSSEALVVPNMSSILDDITAMGDGLVLFAELGGSGSAQGGKETNGKVVSRARERKRKRKSSKEDNTQETVPVAKKRKNRRRTKSKPPKG